MEDDHLIHLFLGIGLTSISVGCIWLTNKVYQLQDEVRDLQRRLNK